METAPVLLEARHVGKSFGKLRVLKDISFFMRRGELVGVVGENGSGKSTLLKILVGLLAPGYGTITVQGRIGYCPQDVRLFERLTLQENIHYFATAYGLRHPNAAVSWESAKDDLLQWFRLEEYENIPVSELSGGTQQKLNLLLALLSRPDILILDEPYNGFDWETYLRFWELTAILRSQNKGILIVSHLVYDRSRFDRVYTLKDGALQCD